MSQALLAIEALCLKTAIAQHLNDLCVFLSIFPEDELALVAFVLVLSTSPIFATLCRTDMSDYEKSRRGWVNADLSLILQKTVMG